MADTSSGANEMFLSASILKVPASPLPVKILVDPAGAIQPYLKEILSIVRTLVQGQEQTSTFISTAYPWIFLSDCAGLLF